jgi:hypothetical protein
LATATTDWINPFTFHHWLKHLILPSVLIAAFLLLPNPWLGFKHVFSTEVLTIELVAKPPIKSITEPKTEVMPEAVQIAPKPVTKSVNPTESPTSTDKNIIKPIETVRPEQQQSEKVSAGQILLSANNRTSTELPAEFQARTGPVKDFFIPEQEITDWFADIPFLDESVDRPTIEMRFYAEGIEGGIEKFFDKITISKTFTTKYGTKIHCALVGVLAVCGWK